KAHDVMRRLRCKKTQQLHTVAIDESKGCCKVHNFDAMAAGAPRPAQAGRPVDNSADTSTTSGSYPHILGFVGDAALAGELGEHGAGSHGGVEGFHPAGHRDRHDDIAVFAD